MVEGVLGMLHGVVDQGCTVILVPLKIHESPCSLTLHTELMGGFVLGWEVTQNIVYFMDKYSIFHA